MVARGGNEVRREEDNVIVREDAVTREVKVARVAAIRDIDLRQSTGNDYTSPLTHVILDKSKPIVRLDPHRELCQFDLAGKCSDDSCTFQHSKPK